MNFRIPSTPEQWIQLAGPIVAAIAAILALVGIGVGAGSSDNSGSSSKSPSTVTATATTTATTVATETVVAPTTVTATTVATTTLTPTSEATSTTSEAASTTPTSEEQTPASEQPVLNKFENNVLETAKDRYEIVDVKVLPAGASGNLSGKPIILYTYEFTNKDTVNGRSKWTFIFDAIQDNSSDVVNELSPGLYFGDDRGPDSLTEVKPGGKLRLTASYQLTDTETPVTLKASNLLGVQYGEQTYPVK